VTIYKGESSGTIKVRLYSDFFLEDDETISLTLTGAVNNTAAISTSPSKKTTKITVKQQNGTSIQLTWGSTAADMNLYMVAGTDDANMRDFNNNYLLGVSVYQQKSTDPANYAFEDVFVPTIFSTIAPNLDTWGLSYNYRSGTLNELTFQVAYVAFTNGDFAEDNLYDFSATYKLANIFDPTVQGANPPAIEQTFTFTGGVISNVSDITVPTTGSRVKSSTNPLLATKRRSLVDATGREVTRIAALGALTKLPVMKSSRTLNLLRR